MDSTEDLRGRRDTELAREAWTRRFSAAPPRLQEFQGLYHSLGLEVLLDPLLPGELADECEGCAVALSLFRVIYTRPGTGRITSPRSPP